MVHDILLLNVIRTNDKNEKKYCKIEFVFWDEKNCVDSDNMKGFPVVSIFYNRDVYDKIPSNIVGKVVKANLEDISNYSNPLKKSTKISSLEYEKNTYNLL